MAQHLLFYDGKCGMCDHLVQHVLKADRRGLFLFAPLDGKTADKVLKEIPNEIKQADSLILIENFQQRDSSLWMYGRGALKVAWLLGGWWVLLGWISFLPPFLYDWGYRLIAKNRRKLFSKNSCCLPKSFEKERFLP